MCIRTLARARARARLTHNSAIDAYFDIPLNCDSRVYQSSRSQIDGGTVGTTFRAGFKSSSCGMERASSVAVKK